MSKTASFFVAGLLVGILIATAGFSLLLGSRNRSQDGAARQIVLKLGHSLDQQHPVHLAMERMRDRLLELSGGTVQLQIFPNSQLGSETECIEQLQRGVLDMTKTSTAPLESFIPEFAIYGVPYLFRDAEHAARIYTGDVGRELLLAGADVGLRGLCYYDAGARSFYTIDRPVLTPADLQGMKIRVQESPAAMALVEVLGGSPTPMAFGELYTGLQTKVVDGAENNPPSFHSNRHFEVCKYLSLDEHSRVPDILLMSELAWGRLSPQIQKWVEQAARESSEYQSQLWVKKTEEVLQAVQDYGVEVHRPDKTPFAERVKPIYEEHEGSTIGALIRRIKEEP